MTEPIIIDGVNVAECENLRKCITPNNETCTIDNSFCNGNKNCYFKQLKRLEKENEELIAQLSCFYRKKEYIRLLKYKQTLEEIRDVLCEGKTFYDGYWDNPETFTQTDKIILKINEVLNEQK